MVNKISFLIVVFSLISCNSIKLKKLSNSVVYDVPKDNNFFKKYDERLNVQLPHEIEIKSVYEYAYHIDYNKNKFYDSHKDNKSALKFYKNGRVNYFFYNGKNNFNPNTQGYRGLCYKEDNSFRLLLVVPVTEDRKYGIQNSKMKI
ncbi:MAG: hypothetical protein ACWIPI_08145, partial [Polaribacter sp.]